MHRFDESGRSRAKVSRFLGEKIQHLNQHQFRRHKRADGFKFLSECLRHRMQLVPRMQESDIVCSIGKDPTHQDFFGDP